jgi:gallate decarboxylase subunit D
MEFELTVGEGRIRLYLDAVHIGPDLVVRLFNEGAHLGAIAIGEYSAEHARTSVSVITLPGHKDDAIAQKAAYLISQHTLKPVCVIAGVHLDNITKDEINRIIENTAQIVQDFIARLETTPG